MANKDEHRATSRVLDILELLATYPEGLTLTEIAEAISAPKSSIFPIVHTMSERKFILENKYNSKYTIGISSFCVGESYSSNKSTLQFINSEMKSIVSQAGEICQMGILDGGDVLYIAKVDSKEPIRLLSHVGKRLPAYCTALGKALLSDRSMEQIKKYYPNGLKVYNERTISNFDDLWSQILEIKKTNVAFENAEYSIDIRCVAVPLFAEGRIIAALSISMPSYRASEEKVLACAKILLDAKTKIETYFNSTHFDIDDFVFNK